MSYKNVDVKVVNQDKPSQWGCLPTVIVCIIFWGLIFGVTFNDTHYSVECNGDEGVHIKAKHKGVPNE